MQPTTGHTEFSARNAGSRGRVADGGGDEVVGGRAEMGVDARGAREFRVFPFGGLEGTAGRIGDLPIWPIPVVPAHLKVAAARKVAALKSVSLLLVEQNECLLGLCDEGALAAAADATPLDEVTKPFDACLRPGMSVGLAREVFLHARAAVLPVIAGGFVLGAITRREVERAIRKRRPSSL